MEGLETVQSPLSHNTSPQSVRSRPTISTGLFLLAFLLCMLISITPIERSDGTDSLQLPTNGLLAFFGGWLPSNLGLTSDSHASQMSTATIEFLLLTGLVFVIYGLFAQYVRKQPPQSDYRSLMRWIWRGTITIGLVFVVTPAMLSHDIFVYASYGRIISIYHANPYFVTHTAFPNDYLLPLDDWKKAVSAYGPVWLAICAGLNAIIGDDAGKAILLYRLFGLAAHLANTFLVIAILRTMKRSERTVTLGMLLYALNPLVLEESSLGGHNDIIMVTLLLLGIFFSLRAELRATATRLRDYLPSLLAFTLAVLIKFTAAPLIVLLLIMLARKMLLQPTLPQQTNQGHTALKWRPALLTTIAGGLICTGLALVIYLPFWINHSLSSILASFSAPPSSYLYYNSINYAIVRWIRANGLPSNNLWFSVLMQALSLRQTWNIINLAVLVVSLIVGAIWLWRTPTTQTLVITALTTLGALLIVTPWFFAWYITWIVGLAVICLPIEYGRVGRALVAATLTFSASAFFTYFYSHGYAPIGGWIGITCLTTIGPPIITLLLFLFFPTSYRKSISKVSGKLSHPIPSLSSHTQ